tara:strand:+ start:404 stop:622 length:219 start_codon:yes stop_codon:yes gene_type:complete
VILLQHMDSLEQVLVDSSLLVVVDQVILELQQHRHKKTLDLVVVEEDITHINQIPHQVQEVLVLLSSHIPPN